MSRLFTISSALALTIAAPAIAQQADPVAPAPVAQTPATVQPEIAPAPVEPSALPTTPAPATTPAPTATPVPAPTAAVTQEAQVTALVETEFPSYDADKTGDLNQSEFTSWVMALQAKAAEAGDANAKKMDDAAKAKWAKAAFASADTDKSKNVNKAEMGKFLIG